MGIEVRDVNGEEFAARASQVLRAAWQPPALHYSAEYVRWMLAFAGPTPAPAVAAFDGAQCIGFAAAINRRLRRGEDLLDVFVVTFVAVHPEARGRGVAAAVYDALLEKLRRVGIPVLTFALDASAGERAIRSAYPRAGFDLRPLGEYPTFATKAAAGASGSWRIAAEEEVAEVLRASVHACQTDAALLWSDPSESQIEHYLRDPRRRRLLVCQTSTEPCFAAWALPVEFVSPAGPQSVITIESVWMPRKSAGELQALACAAAALWPELPPIVYAPNLLGFEPTALRAAGFRQIGSRFQAYCASAGKRILPEDLHGSNLEII